jgi:hypothetical protein
MKIDWKKIERTIGSMKFAVVIITLFALSMIVGTFLESYYGTEFANRVIYKTYWFMLIQLCIFLSIVFAATLRLPPKKRLYGFYTIHAGLITIGVGSLITYIAGVDGQIFLSQNETNRKVYLTKDVLKITYPDEGKQFTYTLPYSAFETKINIVQDQLKFLKFLPFSDGKLTWIESTGKYDQKSIFQSSHYYFKNSFSEQEFTLTLHPEAPREFQDSFSMGPLNISYLPLNIAKCFETISHSKIILWDANSSECFSPESKRYPIKETNAKHRFFAIPLGKDFLTFFPDFSAFPLDLKLKAIENSPIRAISLKVFEKKPYLFLFGTKAAFFDKNEQSWKVLNLEVRGKNITLPWMGAELSLMEHFTDKVPFNSPVPVIPIQKNGTLIKGDLKAVEVEVLGKKYWITTSSALTLMISGKKVIIEVTKDTINLPFELTLTQFKMDKDPGTNSPASYESFVKLFDGSSNNSHHVFMNNPLKKGKFTLYQASYSQDDQGNYSSTLAVNVDQGRPLKYLGSLMLVLGSIWHYNLNKKRKKMEEQGNL